MKHNQGASPLSEDVTVRVDEARLARQWSAVSSGLAARPRRYFYFAALAPAALVAVAMIALLIIKPWRTDVGIAHAPDALVLPDGSRMTLSSGAEVVLESVTHERVHVVLGAGTADLDVTHVEGRRFVVTSGGHDITVLGTAFRVKLDARDGKRTLTVDVARGRVRVSGPTGEHLLDAGQGWSARVDGPANTSASAPASTAALPEGSTSALAVAVPEAPEGNVPADPDSSSHPRGERRPGRSAVTVGPVAVVACRGPSRAARPRHKCAGCRSPARCGRCARHAPEAPPR